MLRELKGSGLTALKMHAGMEQPDASPALSFQKKQAFRKSPEVLIFNVIARKINLPEYIGKLHLFSLYFCRNTKPERKWIGPGQQLLPISAEGLVGSCHHHRTPHRQDFIGHGFQVVGGDAKLGLPEPCFGILIGKGCGRPEFLPPRNRK